MERVGKRGVVKRLLWIAGATLLLSLIVVVHFLIIEGTQESRAVENMVFPVALAATSVRDAYPEICALALSIREDFLLTNVVYRPLDHEALYRFQAAGRPYKSDVVVVWFDVDTTEWTVARARLFYGSEQSRFSPSDLDLTFLDVLDILAIAADAGAPRVLPGGLQIPVRVSWQADYWLVWFPDRQIRVAISSDGEVWWVDRP